MTITQLIQNSPANANELFAKLAATSAGAVKTRDSLFAELKTELELHSRLEEEHLFPALKKHDGTKELVHAAVNGNKQARALMAELDGMPREGEEFIAKLDELRTLFQQHVRDEKKELLPAVKAALSTEETQVITQKIADDKKAVEDERRREADERRASAKRERERDEVERREAEAKARAETKERRAQEEAKRQQAEVRAEQRRAREATERREAEAKATERQAREDAKRRQAEAKARAEAKERRAQEEAKRQQAEVRAEQRRVREETKRAQAETEADERRTREAAEAMAETGETFLRGGESIAMAGARAAHVGVEATVQASRQMADMVGDAVEQSGALVANAVQNYSGTSRPAMNRLQALASMPPVAVDAAVETREAWLEWMSRTAETRGRSSRDLLQAFTPFAVMEAQTRYVGQAMQAWLDASGRMLDISVQASRWMRPGERQDRTRDETTN